MPTTIERLQGILTNKFSVPAEIVKPDALLDTLGLDSLDLVEVLFEVEEVFNIRVPQETSALKTATVQDIVDSIDKALAEAVPQATDS
ncbi:MAG: phosphopantetheine-binding protein [Thermoanaerobaculia bacterium]